MNLNAINVIGNENPPTCVLCGRRTESLGPKVDQNGETYQDEQCLGCGQAHHFYEADDECDDAEG